MKQYTIDYIDKSDDLCHVWVNASSKSDAEMQVRYEYWDIKEIINIHC